MENCLSANRNINVVYTINEPAARGRLPGPARPPASRTGHRLHHRRQLQVRHELRRAASSPRTQRSTPARWPAWASTSIAKLAAVAPSRTTSDGQSFFNTGTNLVATDKPLSGVTSQTPDEAAKACWGS